MQLRPPSEKPATDQPRNQRIVVLDALRGFALAGIVIAHMLENYVASPIPAEIARGMHPHLIDQIADGLSSLLIRGKFFALFSFLFGLSFYLQLEGGQRRGVRYEGTFLWRIVILLGIGYAHSLLYRGDILLLYALLALPLVPFFHAPRRLTLALAALIFLGIWRYLVFYFHSNQPLFMDYDPYDPEHPVVLEYFRILREGSFAELVNINAWQGIVTKMEFQFGIFNRGSLTFGFFLLGLLAGQAEFFSRFRELKASIRNLWISGLALFGVSVAVVLLIFSRYGQGADIEFTSWDLMFGLTAFDLLNVGLTMVWVAVFLIIYRTPRGEAWLNRLAPFGRMALTNYLLQSVIGCWIYFGWGLGLLGKIPSSQSLGLAFALILLQVVLSRFWLARFRYGPIEWIWRNLTHLRWHPLRR